jgi:hypothetical protein
MTRIVLGTVDERGTRRRTRSIASCSVPAQRVGNGYGYLVFVASLVRLNSTDVARLGIGSGGSWCLVARVAALELSSLGLKPAWHSQAQ